MPQAARQDLFELGQRPYGGLVHARDGVPRTGPQPTAIATASSSSRTSGGMAFPATSRYPPSAPIVAWTG